MKSSSQSSNNSYVVPKKLQKIKSSFFNQQNKTPMWVPILDSQQKLESQVEGFLFKETKRSTLKERYFSLSGDTLFLHNQDGKTAKKQFNINNSILQRILNENGPEQKHGFRLTKNQISVDFYTQSLQVSDLWFNFLKISCIQRSFHDFYSINKIIGKGNFAKVYSATYKNTGKIVAVKAFDKEKFINDTLEQTALIKELSIMRKMDHKSVIKLYEVFENDTFIFVVCEYLEGGEFFNHLQKAIHYDENLLAVAVYNILQAVEYIHSTGVLHRDIKPENIILRTKGDIKDVCIADFGLADYYNPECDYTFRRCGTPGYVAPEILQDKIYDYKIDLFSVGVLMFIMLSGTSPFKASSYNEIVMKNYNCEINFNVKGLSKKISKEALQLLHDLLDMNPQNRPSATDALKYKWFEKHVNRQLVQETQKLSLDGVLPRFNPQENPGLYSKTPLMNQDLCLFINSTPQGITPQTRSKSSTRNADVEKNSQTQDSATPKSTLSNHQKAIIGPKYSTPLQQQKQLINDTIDQFDLDMEQCEEFNSSGQIKKYHMLTKMKRYVNPEKNESSDSLSVEISQPSSNLANVRSALKEFEKL